MLKRVLVANRGEVAVRVARTASDLGIATVAVYAADDAASSHRFAATTAAALPASGARAYLDGATLIAIARREGCDAVHPGYGFLSENESFAAAVEAVGLVFVGPTPATLRTLGDKAAARALAVELGVPLLAGSNTATSLEQARAFFVRCGRPILIKALAGGGGRGIRIVRRAEDIEAAYVACRAESLGAFGNGDLYVEEMLDAARHVEVQVVGDGDGTVAVLGERECTLQRRHQKLVELAPSPSLTAALRERIHAAAMRMAAHLAYRGLGTFEFLVEGERFAFMEANPRLQVEHTVTEAIYGIDLVAVQFEIAGGGRPAQRFKAAPPGASGAAVQLRVNAETMQSDASAVSASGTVDAVAWPGGPGVRIDTHAYPGHMVSPAYDSLLAKVIVHAASSDHGALMRKAHRVLSELRVDGVATNSGFLMALLADPDVVANRVTTRFIDTHAARLVQAAQSQAPALPARTERTAVSWTIGEASVVAPLPGSVVSVGVRTGDAVVRGQTLMVLESMKMEHLIEARWPGIVGALHVAAGTVVAEGQPLLELQRREADGMRADREQSVDLDLIRPDLRHVIDAHALTLDENRPQSVARRRKLGLRTARENIADLVDPGSFIEYGALVVAAQRRRRTVDDLKVNTPADGLITGIGTVNAAHVPMPEQARVALMAYDYTVLAGTQGKLNHKKSDRLLDLAEQWRLPLVLYAEGGGGRPGDTDVVGVAGLDVPTFHRYAQLSGRVPVIGVVAGYCFAGNAALLGCSDVVIATRSSSIGMGGPAMIEGGGLGVVAPEAVGPTSVQVPNGVIDIVADYEKEATAIAKRYLGYAQGLTIAGSAADQRLLRHVIPENRLRVYDIHRVVATLADEGSVLEFRPEFGIGAVTAFVRIEGKPFALVANNPKHLGGALDGPACDKLARFLQLADSYGLPIVSLCDTPGFMVGPESEKTAMVRRTSRLFLAGAALRVPVFCIVLRKGYGLGAMAMAGGSFRAPMFTVSWPSGEFGGMGLEGYVRLGFRKELEAVPEGPEREALYKRMVAEQYDKGKATNMASFLEIDAVIDPAETRHWLLRGLASVPTPLAPRRPFVDAF